MSSVTQSNEHDVDFSNLKDCLDKQRSAFLRDGPPALTQRQASLNKLRQAILARKQAFESALVADFGNRARHETAIMEIMSVIQGIDYLRRHLRQFMRPQKRHVPLTFQPARAYISYQPLGVIGIISPWNFPMALALMPLATAIAAGNRAMIKPSEMTPACSALLAQMLGEIFASNEVAVFTGNASVGTAFSRLPFDHLLFTGSTQVGRHIMRAASENLVPVTLELGGKSPVIIAPDHSLTHAAGEIAYGKLANCGQICVAPDYVLVHESQVGQFVDAYDDAVRKLYPAGPLSEQYSSIINAQHYNRLTSLLEDARSKKARIMEVGIQPQDAKKRSRTIAPTVVSNVTDDMTIVHEEIFGPILPIVSYRDINEAIAYINRHPRPLALYYFGRDNADRHNVMARTTSGNVTVNTTILHYAIEDLPFGGVGPSGMGSYHGVEGFRSLSHAKGTLELGRWNMSSLLKPPFGRITNFILGAMLR